MFEISKYYHIYNHANGDENIFNEEQNYCFFLEKYQFYISPIADTLAYCLMPNHFHFLVKIKSEGELRATSQKFAERSRTTFEKFGVEKGVEKEASKNLQGLAEEKAKQNLEGLVGEKTKQNFESLNEEKSKQNLENLESLISQRFSNLFNSYTKSFNKIYHRRGSLFVPNYKRKEINSEEYLKQVILYIHNNPVKHGFTLHPSGWKFSSYNKILEKENTFVLRNKVISLFENPDNFIYMHNHSFNILNTLLLED